MSIKVLGRSAGCVSVLLLGIMALASPPAVHYHLLKKAPLGAAAAGGREYFDYLTVDAHARRVYASHGTEVKVADADSGAVVGTISGLKQCHGIALVEELGKGFISDGGAAKTVIFDMASLKVTGEVKGEEDADSIIYDPASKGFRIQRRSEERDGDRSGERDSGKEHCAGRRAGVRGGRWQGNRLRQYGRQERSSGD